MGDGYGTPNIIGQKAPPRRVLELSQLQLHGLHEALKEKDELNEQAKEVLEVLNKFMRGDEA